MHINRTKMVIMNSTINLEKVSKESGIPLDLLKNQIKTESLNYSQMIQLSKKYNFRVIDYSRNDLIQQLQNYQKKNTKIPTIGIMGHIDHGKTTLVDYLLKTTVTNKESGGITQYISTYRLHTKFGDFLMIDTPGHEIFTMTRSIILSLIDILVLVVAADDGVKEQTKEIVKSADKITKIVCINKIDTGQDNLDHIFADLSNINILSEHYGGEVFTNLVSAKTGEGINELLENIQLQSDTIELKTNNEIEGQGVVIDSILQKGMGIIWKIILNTGTIEIGDNVLISGDCFKIKNIICNGQKSQSAGVGDSIEIIGANNQPIIGSKLFVINNDELTKHVQKSLDNNQETIIENQTSGLNFVLKVDRTGKTQILKSKIAQLGKIVSASMGEINDTDVRSAKGSNAIVVGWCNFNKQSIKILEERNIKYAYSDIIYKLLDDIDILTKKKIEDLYKDVGTGNITHIFNIKGFKIAGCRIINGNIKIGQMCEVRNKDKIITRSKIVSMKREKFDIEEARTDSECGIILDSKNTQFNIGDQIIALEKV